MARYYLTRDVLKLMRISGDNFGTFGLSLGFSKFDTDLKNNITDILLYYVDKGRQREDPSDDPIETSHHSLGIIQRLHDEWYVYENCEFKRLNQVSDASQEIAERQRISLIILLGSHAIGRSVYWCFYSISSWHDCRIYYTDLRMDHFQICSSLLAAKTVARLDVLFTGKKSRCHKSISMLLLSVYIRFSMLRMRFLMKCTIRPRLIRSDVSASGQSLFVKYLIQ